MKTILPCYIKKERKLPTDEFVGKTVIHRTFFQQ